MFTTETSLVDLDDFITKLEADQERPEWLAQVRSANLYVNADIATTLLARNVKPAPGKGGTNRPEVTGSKDVLIGDILNGNWRYSHQGIAFNVSGDLIDGQHRLESIIRADKVEPGISIPLMVTWGLPAESNEKIDLARRRTVGTFLAMDGYTAGARLATSLRLIYLYERNNFEGPVTDVYWKQNPDVTEIRKCLQEHPYAPDGCLIGGQLQGIITASAASAAWTLCREKYPDEMNMEFVSGLKSGANLSEGDARLALRQWALNQKVNGKRAIPYVHMAAYLKAFTAFRRQETVRIITFKPTVERFPRA